MTSLIAAAIAVLAFGCLAVSASTGVLFSTLQQTLVVSATPKPGDVLMAGEGKLTVFWRTNGSVPDSQYDKVKIKLCYAPVSQVDRPWRKTKDDLKKDKTCQFKVTEQPYSRDLARKEQSSDYHVTREIPTGVFFVRAYVFDSDGRQVAYGQTTNRGKTTNLFEIKGVSGLDPSLNVAAACFSTVSVVALAAIYMYEKRKTN